MRILVIGMILLAAILGGCSQQSAMAPESDDAMSVDVDKLATVAVATTGAEINERTWEIADVVQRAARSFAADNDGVLPGAPGEVNLLGKRIVDYFADGYPLLNAATGFRTEPQWGSVAATPGQVAYRALTNSSGEYTGFNVTACGAWEPYALWIEYRDAVPFASAKGPRIDFTVASEQDASAEQITERTFKNIEIVFGAMKQYAQVHDGYFSDILADVMPNLPGGILLVNAATGFRTEPQFAGRAAIPGQLGCELIVDDRGAGVGAYVSAVGANFERLQFLYFGNGPSVIGAPE